MNSLEYFLEKYESNLDGIVVGGGWAVEIFQNRTHNPHREHDDVDTLVLDKSLNVECHSSNVPEEYFGSIDVESVDWLLDFIVEKQVVCKGKAYDVKVLCPEFIAVSKAFSKMGEAREKDNGDIRHIFDTVDLDRGKISILIEKAGLLQEGSNFLELLAEKGLEPVSYSRDDFNKRLFQKKWGLEKIPEQMTSKTLDSYDFLFSKIKKGLGAGWLKNHKKRTQEILNNNDAQKARIYGWAIWDVLEYAGESMKEGLANRLLAIPDADKAENYGIAIGYALEYAGDDMKQDLVEKLNNIKSSWIEKLQGISDEDKARSYGMAIRNALSYAGEDMKPNLAKRILSIPDVDKAKNYGGAIRDELRYAGKDLKTQQRLISNMFEDS